MKCPRCGGQYETRVEPREVDFGGSRKATVQAEFYRCARCGDTFFTMEQADAVRLRASKEIRRREGLLMPEEIAHIRRRFGLSQDLFQKLIGKGKKTVVRWEAGSVFQSRLADKFLRVIRRFPFIMEYLAEAEEVDLPPPPQPIPPLPTQRIEVLHRPVEVPGVQRSRAGEASAWAHHGEPRDLVEAG